MAKQTINIGTTANDGTGDTLRGAGQKINSNFTEVYNLSQAAFDTANTGGGVDLGYFKIYGNTLGTKDDPDTGGWGGYTINIDPNGEGWSGIQIQSLAGQEAGGALTIFNNKEANSRINLNTQDGVQIYSNRGFLNLGSDMEAPGSPSHFHIAFDNSNSVIPGSDLFLGDDFNFLRVVNNAQGVFIGANNRTGGDQYEWRFDTDGALNLTGNGVVRKIGPVNIVASDYAQLQWVDSGNVSIIDPNSTQGPTNWLFVDFQGIHLETNLNQEGNSFLWSYGNDGNLTFPNSSIIKDVPDGAYANGLIFSVNGNETKFDTGGRLHTPNDLVINYGGLVFPDSSVQTTAYTDKNLIIEWTESEQVITLDTPTSVGQKYTIIMKFNTYQSYDIIIQTPPPSEIVDADECILYGSVIFDILGSLQVSTVGTNSWTLDSSYVKGYINIVYTGLQNIMGTNYALFQLDGSVITAM